MKMRNAYLIGGLFCAEALAGLLLMLCPKGFSVTAGVIMICLGLAAGMLLNPGGLCLLLAGVAILVLPRTIAGVILLLLSMVGMTCNLIQGPKQ